MRKGTAIIVALVALVAGGVLGALGMREVCRMTVMAYDMASVDHVISYMQVQRYADTPEAYEAALRDHLVVLDRRESMKRNPLLPNDPLLSGNIDRLDRVLAYIRLSVLATQRGRVDDAAKYQKQALAACPALGWKTCDWEHMSALVQKLDERSSWNPDKATSSHGS